jgi:aspartate/methionine/tyrosine aminotransferase
VLDRLERAKHYTSICNSAPSEILGLIALRAADQLLEKNRQIITGNLVSFNQFFSSRRSLFEWQEPQGGCVAFPRYLGSEGVESMCTALVEEAGVLLLPASIYRSSLTTTPADRFRVGVGRSGPQEALEVWAAWLDKRL